MSKGSFLAIFSANSILRLRSLDMSPTTGSNYNELSKISRKYLNRCQEKANTSFKSDLGDFSSIEKDLSFSSFQRDWGQEWIPMVKRATKNVQLVLQHCCKTS